MLSFATSKFDSCGDEAEIKCVVILYIDGAGKRGRNPRARAKELTAGELIIAGSRCCSEKS